MEVKYLIVGGGPAGALAGYLLQQAGEDVLIIERSVLEKKDKLCGGILTQKTYDILTKYYPQEEIDALIQKHFDRCLMKTDIVLRDVFDINLRMVKRKDLDAYLIAKYISIGGRVFEKEIISTIDNEEKIVVTQNLRIKYKTLIGADGALSQVRKIIIGKAQPVRLGIESFPEGNLDLPLPIVEFKLGYPGYNLVAPLKDCCLFGVGGLSDKQRLLEELALLGKDLPIDLSSWGGGFVPTGEEVVLEYNNVFFLGDAAGLIHPFTGEGIYYALFSAESLVQALLGNGNYTEMLFPITTQMFEWNGRLDTWISSLYNNPMALIALSLSDQSYLNEAFQNVFS